MRFIKKIMERGNVTIPSDVREALGVEEGDIVEFEIVGVVRKGPDATDEGATRRRQESGAARRALEGPANAPGRTT